MRITSGLSSLTALTSGTASRIHSDEECCVSQSASDAVPLLVEPGGEMDGEGRFADAALGICDDDGGPACAIDFDRLASLKSVRPAGAEDMASGLSSRRLAGHSSCRQEGRTKCRQARWKPHKAAD